MAEPSVSSGSSSPTISPVRIIISPQHIPEVPSSAALSSSRIFTRSDVMEDLDLNCYETFLDDDDSVKRKRFEPVEDTMDRYVLSVKSGSQMIASLWNEVQVKQDRLRHENSNLKRKIDRQEDSIEELKHELSVLKSVNKMMARTVHRFKKSFIEKENLNEFDKCPLCTRTVSELLSDNLSLIRVGCCANDICLECIVNLTYTQASSRPLCPFCRNSLC